MKKSHRSIGQLAAAAGVPTSTVRYYERRGLITPDAFESGQRRYKDETLRLLVFVGMLQDAGLSLDDIEGVLDASDVESWKAIAAARLERLNETIDQLQHARAYLEGTLLCHFPHPATECKIMNAEIDRRLTETSAVAGVTTA